MRRAAAMKMGPNDVSGIVWAISFFFSLCFCILTFFIIFRFCILTQGKRWAMTMKMNPNQG